MQRSTSCCCLTGLQTLIPLNVLRKILAVILSLDRRQKCSNSATESAQMKVAGCVILYVQSDCKNEIAFY